MYVKIRDKTVNQRIQSLFLYPKTVLVKDHSLLTVPQNLIVAVIRQIKHVCKTRRTKEKNTNVRKADAINLILNLNKIWT